MTDYTSGPGTPDGTDHGNPRSDLQGRKGVEAVPPGYRDDPHGYRDDDISLFALLGGILRHRWAIVGITALVTAVVVIHTVVTFTPTYTADAAFMPQGARDSGSGGLRSLAGQFGVTVPGDGGSDSPEFYADLLGSRTILGPLVSDTFTVGSLGGGGERRGTLAELLEVDGRSPEAVRLNTLEWLRDEAVSRRSELATGKVSFSVSTPWPQLSAELAERLLRQVNDFNLQNRQSQAAAERTFIEGRLDETRRELEEAEGALRRFLEANRQFSSSPELVFEHDRLQREVALRQSVVSALSQSFEEARISEVRNLPVITILESPEVPIRHDGRGLALRGVLALFLGAMLGVGYAFVRELQTSARKSGDPDFQAFDQVWQETLNDLRGPFRRRSETS